MQFMIYNSISHLKLLKYKNIIPFLILVIIFILRSTEFQTINHQATVGPSCSIHQIAFTALSIRLLSVLLQYLQSLSPIGIKFTKLNYEAGTKPALKRWAGNRGKAKKIFMRGSVLLYREVQY